MKDKDKIGIHIDVSKSLSATKSTIYEVPEGYILEIDEIVVQNGSTAGTMTLTDEGTYKDGTTAYLKTVHKQYLSANEFDDTRNFDARVYASLEGAMTGAATGDVIVKGRLI